MWEEVCDFLVAPCKWYHVAPTANLKAVSTRGIKAPSPTFIYFNSKYSKRWKNILITNDCTSTTVQVVDHFHDPCVCWTNTVLNVLTPPRVASFSNTKLHENVEYTCVEVFGLLFHMSCIFMLCDICPMSENAVFYVIGSNIISWTENHSHRRPQSLPSPPALPLSPLYCGRCALIQQQWYQWG